jgi:hypothetical protein
LPIGISGTDCLTIVKALRCREILDESSRQHIKEIVDAILELGGDKFAVFECVALIKAFHHIPNGQKKETTDAFLRLNKERLNIVEWAEIITSLSSISSGRKIETVVQANEIIMSMKRSGSVPIDARSNNMMSYVSLLCDRDVKISEVIKLVDAINSLAENKEKIVKIVARHNDITSLNIKSCLIKNLLRVHDTAKIDSIITCTHSLLLRSYGFSDNEIVELLIAVDGSKHRENMCQIIHENYDQKSLSEKCKIIKILSQKSPTERNKIVHYVRLIGGDDIYNPSSSISTILSVGSSDLQKMEDICQIIHENYIQALMSEKCKIIEILFQRSPTERNEIVHYVKLIGGSTGRQPSEYINAILFIDTSDRKSIMDAVLNITAGKRPTLEQLRALIEILITTPSEKRADATLLANLREGILDKGDRFSISVPRLNQEKVIAATMKYDPQVIDFSKLFVHENMTTYECLLIYEEINNILPDNRVEFIDKVQQLVNNQSIDASIYLKVFGIAKRMPSPEWNVFVSKIKSKKLTRLNLHDVEVELGFLHNILS